MKFVYRACLGMLGLIIASVKASHAASAQRGDLVYLEEVATFRLFTTLRVKSPLGVHRGSLRLKTPTAVYQFDNVGVSNDGRLAFLTSYRVYSDEGGGNVLLDSDVWVVAIKHGTPKVLSRHSIAPFMKDALAGCGIAGAAAVAAGSPAGVMYPVFLGLACNRGCSPDSDDEGAPVFGASWVLQLSYDVRTRKLTKAGATRISAEKLCRREIADQVRALKVPRLPGGRNGTPVMVFGERDARTFRLRSIKPGSRNLLSWRSKAECVNFVIGGPSEMYAICPGRSTTPYGVGVIKQIKRTPRGQRVTGVGRTPTSLGRTSYRTGLAVLEGASQPLYAVTTQARENGKDHIIKYSKAALGAAGKLALKVAAGKQQGECHLMAVVP